MYLPDRPEQTEWRCPGTEKFLKEVYNFHDKTLERALKYLYRSSIGYFVLDSKEKISLDHFKSIEIIINSLGKKRINGKKTTFKQKLEDVATKIGITKEEKDRIKNFSDERSKYGDVAHPSRFDEAERYPNQFPIPSNTRYSGGGFDSIAPSILLKYYYYIKGVYIVDIDEPSDRIGSGSNKGKFTKVYQISFSEPVYLNHLVFYSSVKNKQKLARELKKAFVKKFKLTEDSIAEIRIMPGKEGIAHQGRRIKIRVAPKT